MQATEERDAVSEDAPVAPPAPRVLGRYHLMRPLGSGGFGTVHEAWDERLERWVAVKAIPSHGTAPERARREARAAARLDHPNVVALYDAGEEPGARYLVFELVDGATMADLLEEDRLDDRDVLRIGLAVADALEHAHERGVVHRDLKPQNVLVPRGGGWSPLRGEGAVAKLADFGVAHLAGDEALTRTGDVLGTLAYMAPEQAAGARVDERADLYSLALVLYEGLAGRHPVKAGNAAATARKVGTVLPSLAGRRPDLDADLCAAIDAALLPDPEQRGTLADLADAVAESLLEVADSGGTIAPHPLERRRLAMPFAARVLNAAGTGVLCAVALDSLTSDPAIDPFALGFAASLATLALPRVGWLAALLLTVVAVGGSPAPRPGAALLLFFAVLPAPLLVRARPTAWSLPAAAPLLGLVALAGAFPALAGQARTAARRAAFGAVGAWATLLAEPLMERTLLFGAPLEVPPRAAFDGGASLAITEVLGRVCASEAMLAVPLWALAAAVLPWLVRGRSFSIDAGMAAGWACALAVGTEAVAAASAPVAVHPTVLGPLLAGLLAVAAKWFRAVPRAGY